MNQTKIDRRRKYYLMVDVETANMIDDPLVYDLGFAVCDKHGNIYEQESVLIYEVFCEMNDLMKTAYYANKLPLYRKGLGKKEFRIVRFMTAWKMVRDIIAKYDITEVWAYNARFDRGALDTTIRYLTKSKFRYFFSKKVKIHCVWHVACQTILLQKAFAKWAIQNEKVSEKGNLKTSAEIAYAYITREPDFEEQHTGLADVQIEVAILAKCLAQHKAIKKYPYRACWRIPTKGAKAEGFLPLPEAEEKAA